MGTWGMDPFSNDAAADLLSALEDLEDAEPAAALQQLRLALIDAVGNHAYLEVDDAQAAVAAAAILAAQLPGGPRLDPSLMPASLAVGGLDLPDELAHLARMALDRVVGERSELRGLWQEGGRLEEFLGTLAPLRAALAAGGPAADTAPARRHQGQRRSTRRQRQVDVIQLAVADVPIPEFFLQDIGDPRQCQVVDYLGRARAAIPEECVGLERLAVWAAEHVEERIRDHYQGRPNAYLESMKLRR